MKRDTPFSDAAIYISYMTFALIESNGKHATKQWNLFLEIKQENPDLFVVRVPREKKTFEHNFQFVCLLFHSVVYARQTNSQILKIQ